jgi:hypothetical protein
MALADRCNLPNSGGDTGLHLYIFKSLSSLLQITPDLYSTIFFILYLLQRAVSDWTPNLTLSSRRRPRFALFL